MAFAFAIPAIGSAVLPAIGAIGSTIASIPVIGGALSAPISAIGALGSGLTGAGSALAAGNLAGAGSSLLSGALGAGANVVGGLGGLYGAADKLVGGFLPNIGGGSAAGGIGVSPAQGYLGQMFPNAIGNKPMFGGMVDGSGLPMSILPGETAGVPNSAGGGIGGFFEKAVKGAQLAKKLGFGGEEKTPGTTSQAIQARQINEGGDNGPKTRVFGGGATPGNTSLQLSPPQAAVQYGAGMGVPGTTGYQNALAELLEQAIQNAVYRPKAAGQAFELMSGGRNTSMIS